MFNKGCFKGNIYNTMSLLKKSLVFKGSEHAVSRYSSELGVNKEHFWYFYKDQHPHTHD